MNNEAFMKVLDSIVELRETILEAVVPEEAQHHFRASRREALLGVKAVLDHSIERLDGQVPRETQAEKHSSRTIEITE
jgi:hypothetical protein